MDHSHSSRQTTPSRSKAALGIASLVLAVVLASPLPAAAQSSCDTDIGSLQKKRQAQIGEINKLGQKDGKLDPILACPRLRSLAATETEMLGYMQKNQNWCNIPDDVIANVKDGSSKTADVAKQACSIAAQIRKQQQEQQAAGATPGFGAPVAPRLPTGPL